jgi:hypothetical protein
VAFVSGLQHADALAAAASLVRQLGEASIFVDVPRVDGAAALRRSGFPVDRVTFLTSAHDVLGASLFAGSARELMARAKHADYVEQERARGVPVDENPSLRPWEELPDSLRLSNRRFADSIGNRLADLGAALEPLTGAVGDPGVDPRLVEELARTEHDRWMEDLIADGWRYHDGEKDAVRKLHPLLVPWEQLDEADQEKDRDSIRGIPTYLARVGYELRIDLGS